MLRFSDAKSVNEKIEVLEALEDRSLSTTFDHSSFALEKAEELSQLPDLTYPQQLRLSWMFGLDDIDVEETVNRLLASFTPEGAEKGLDELFLMETLFQIDMFATDEQRSQILDRYNTLITKAVAEHNLSLQTRLLNLSAKYLLPRLNSLSAKITDLAVPEFAL